MSNNYEGTSQHITEIVFIGTLNDNSLTSTLQTLICLILSWMGMFPGEAALPLSFCLPFHGGWGCLKETYLINQELVLSVKSRSYFPGKPTVTNFAPLHKMQEKLYKVYPSNQKFMIDTIFTISESHQNTILSTCSSAWWKQQNIHMTICWNFNVPNFLDP